MKNIVNRTLRKVTNRTTAKLYTDMYGDDRDKIAGRYKPSKGESELFMEYQVIYDSVWKKLENELTREASCSDILFAIGVHDAAYDAIFAATAEKELDINNEAERELDSDIADVIVNVFRLAQNSDFICYAKRFMQCAPAWKARGAYFKGYSLFMEFVYDNLKDGEMDGIPVIPKQLWGDN